MDSRTLEKLREIQLKVDVLWPILKEAKEAGDMNWLAAYCQQLNLRMQAIDVVLDDCGLKGSKTHQQLLNILGIQEQYRLSAAQLREARGQAQPQTQTIETKPGLFKGQGVKSHG